jgi:hypothetical protein
MIRIPEFAAPVVPASVITAAIACNFGKPGLSTKRAIDADEVEELAAELQNAKRRVRVYSAWGFVPNSYRNRCTIQFVEATLIDGVWHIGTGWCGAQRSGGSASRVVVQ